MTRDEAKELLSAYDRLTKYYTNHIDVMREYAKGADIQYESGGHWVDVATPSFTTKDTYRVKPTPITVKGWVCVKDDFVFGWRIGDVRSSKPQSEAHWKEFTTTVEV